MVEIIPAVLEADPQTFAERVRTASSFASFLHIDICDGVFVPTQSIAVGHVRANTPTVPFALHLMVADPRINLDAWLATDAQRFILHCTRVANVEEVLKRIRDSGRETVLAVHPDTIEQDCAFIIPRLGQLAAVLFVAVPPGSQGGVTDERALLSAAAFQKAHPETRVVIDGGLRSENVSRYRETGVTQFVVGSAIWSAPDPATAYRELRDAFNT